MNLEGKAMGEAARRRRLGQAPETRDQESPAAAIIQIGEAGNLTPEAAAEAAWTCVSTSRRYPDAELSVLILDYDDDPGAIWQTPEAQKYLVYFRHALAALGVTLSKTEISDDSGMLLKIRLDRLTREAS